MKYLEVVGAFNNWYNRGQYISAYDTTPHKANLSTIKFAVNSKNKQRSNDPPIAKTCTQTWRWPRSQVKEELKVMTGFQERRRYFGERWKTGLWITM